MTVESILSKFGLVMFIFFIVATFSDSGSGKYKEAIFAAIFGTIYIVFG